MRRILCSTGTFAVKKSNDDLSRMKEIEKRCDFDGFELMLYSRWFDRLDEIASEVKSMKSPILAVHAIKEIGGLLSGDNPEERELAFRQYERCCKVARELCAEKLVLHLWNGLTSDKHISRNYSAVERLMEIANAYSTTLCVENVVCNTFDPLSHFFELHELFPELRFTFDTKMSAFHNQLEASTWGAPSWLWHGTDQKPPSVAHVHVSDYGGGYMEWDKLRALHIGCGNIDFERFYDFIKANDYCGDITLEASSVAENGTINYEALVRSFEKLRELDRVYCKNAVALT